MRGSQDDLCGCFPTGRHYPGIADQIAASEVVIDGVVREFDAGSAWLDHPFCIIDFETTGLSAENDRVLEMAIVSFDRGELTSARSWLINPGMPVPEESRKVHGITDEELATAPFFAELAVEIEAALAGRIPVAYNANFDRRFLHAEFARLGRAPSESLAPALRPSVEWIDPLVWVRELQKYEKGKKLTDVVARMGIELTRAHRAEADAEATGRVLLALSPQMPRTYGELVRIQKQYAGRQEAEMKAWRSRRGSE